MGRRRALCAALITTPPHRHPHPLTASLLPLPCPCASVPPSLHHGSSSRPAVPPVAAAAAGSGSVHRAECAGAVSGRGVSADVHRSFHRDHVRERVVRPALPRRAGQREPGGLAGRQQPQRHPLLHADRRQRHRLPLPQPAPVQRRALRQLPDRAGQRPVPGQPVLGRERDHHLRRDSPLLPGAVADQRRRHGPLRAVGRADQQRGPHRAHGRRLGHGALGNSAPHTHDAPLPTLPLSDR